MEKRANNPNIITTENSFDYRVLTTADREAWGALVDGVPQRDAFFRAEYLLPFEHLADHKAKLFFFGDENNYIIYPFFLRPINTLPFYQERPLDSETPYYDIVSPYGYSGPLACVSDQELQDELWRQYLQVFHRYCLRTNIVCEFARLNPFTGNEQPLQKLTEGVRADNEIIYLDLTVTEKGLWRGLNRGNRSNINKARRSGMQIERREDGEAIGRFYELYLATMRRNRAARWYEFSFDFFKESFALLDDNITLFCATYEGQTIAAASFLHDGHVVHYFLGSSDSDYLSLRPNNLLMYEAICWAKRQGYHFFNLGGGYKDSLARFKAAFSKQSKTFYTYRTIHHHSIYNVLCQRHALYVSEAGQLVGKDDYFPRYRANHVEQ